MSKQKTSSKRPQEIIFAVALIGIPALILWIYFAPTDQGVPTFEKLQSQTQQEENSPLEVMEEMWKHHPGHGPVALELANLYLADGQYRKALEFYNIFIEDDTSATGWEVRLDMSRAYAGLMKPDSAIWELNLILDRDPNHSGALYNLGAIEANRNNYSRAKEVWQLLIEKHPQDTLAKFALAALPKINKPDGHP